MGFKDIIHFFTLLQTYSLLNRFVVIFVVTNEGKLMPLRKMKQKKYAGIYEYYRTSDPDKTAVAYYVNVRDTSGSPKKIKTEAKTADEAAILLSQMKHDKKARPTTTHNSSLLEYGLKWFEGRNTINNGKDRQKFLRHVSDVLGSKKVDDITRKDLFVLQTSIKAKGLSPKTVNNVVDVVTIMLNYAYKMEHVLTLPPKIDKLKVDNERQRILTTEELQYLFNESEGKVKIALLLLYYTGQRPKSILQLQKKHITQNGIFIKSIKGQQTHVVPMSDKLANYILPWIDNMDADDYLVFSANNHSKPLSYTRLNALAKPFFDELNAGLNPHEDRLQWASMYTLRHTSLTNVLAGTNNIYAAKSLANHSTLQMTQRYVKLADKAKQDAVDSF